MANNKDIQLKETMVQMNTTRKKTKEMILEEKKKLEKLEKVPNESKKVTRYNLVDNCSLQIIIIHLGNRRM